jgi:hypothetical protein
MSEGKTFTSKTVLLSLFNEGNRIKEETSAIGGKFGERIRAQVENGRLHSAAFSKAMSIYRKSRNNEMEALDQIDNLRFYLEVIEGEIRDKGHMGNLDDMARPSVEQIVSGLEPAEATPTDALSPKDALTKLRAARDKNPPPSPDEVEARQNDGAAKRRGRPPKLSVVGSEDAVAPPPPPPVSLLDDDEEFEAAAPTPPAPPSGAALSA